MSETPAVANRLVAAVAAQDFDGITGLLSPDARFRYLIPKGPTPSPSRANTMNRSATGALVMNVLRPLMT